MPLRPSDVRVPPERQSNRIRSRASNQEIKETITQVPSPRVERSKLQTSDAHQHNVATKTNLVPTLKEEYDDNNDNDDAVSNDSENDDDDTTFKSRKKLSGSSVQRWKLAELTQRIDTGWIDLDPEYQREIVWNAKSMSGLINSLIEDYYIPPIIFNLHEEIQQDGSRKQRRVCVDGKQRLSSVHAFMRGEIPCTDRNGKDWYYCIPLEDDDQPLRQRKKRRIWTEHLRQEFRNKSFVSYEFKDLTRVQEEDLFARVQKGMPLNAAEKLRGTSGPWQDLAKQYEEEFNEVVGLSVSDRSTGFRNILAAFSQILETREPSNADGKPQNKFSMASVQKLCSKHQHLLGGTNKAYLYAVFSKFKRLVVLSPKTFQNNDYKVARNFAPIEVVAVAVLISEYMDSRNNNMLLGDIQTMRQIIREHLPDLRMDGVTWKTIWQFISELESFRGAADGSSLPKKTFTPNRVTNREMSRVNQSQRPPMSQTIETNAAIRPNRPSTASEGASTRSTPLFTPISAVSSHSSLHQNNTVERDNQSRERSGSVDSVFGETSEITNLNRGSARLTGSFVTIPMAPVASMSRINQALPTHSHPRETMESRLKLERPEIVTTSHKRPFPAGNVGIAPGARALQAKRPRISKAE